MKQQDNQVTAIIVARGGSKRLLRKNVLPFCGLPLVEWSILQAVCSRYIGAENTYLTTDDDEIASIGKKHNLNIIWRPDWENPDKLSAAFVVHHAIHEIRKERECDTIIDIMPTCPMRLPDDMDRAIIRYSEFRKLYPGCGELIWTIPQPEFHIRKYLDDHQMMIYLFNKGGYFSQAGNWSNVSSADYYLNTHQIVNDEDVQRNDIWMEPGKIGRAIYYINGKWFQRFDIDNQEDFGFCELLMERYVLKGRDAQLYWDYKERHNG